MNSKAPTSKESKATDAPNVEASLNPAESTPPAEDAAQAPAAEPEENAPSDAPNVEDRENDPDEANEPIETNQAQPSPENGAYVEVDHAPPIVHYLALSLVYANPKRPSVSQVHGLDLYRAKLEDGKAIVTCEKNYYDAENSQGSIDRLRARLGNLASIIKGATDQIKGEKDMIQGAYNAGLADNVLKEVVAAHTAAITQHQTVLEPAEAEYAQIEAEIELYQARIDSRETYEWVLELPE